MLKKERRGRQQQKTPYTFEKNKKEDNMTEALEDIAMLRPGKNAQIAAKKISKKYQKTRSEKWRAASKRKLADEVVPTQEKKYRKLTDLNEKRKTKNNIEVVSEISDSAAKKIAAKKKLEKYRKMRNAKNKKKLLVNEEDLETIDYNEPTREENLIEKESILAAANKVFELKTG